MANTKPVVEDQRNVITLKCAQDWHKAFKIQNKKSGFDKEEFPNSIVIPFADIEQIVNDVRRCVDETINGVRIYFVIKPKRKPNGKLNISCICVPTKGPYLNDPNVSFTDVIIKATRMAGTPENPDCPDGGNTAFGSGAPMVAAAVAGAYDGVVSIYDVTRPCPPMCDAESPINAG